MNRSGRMCKGSEAENEAGIPGKKVEVADA